MDESISVLSGSLPKRCAHCAQRSAKALAWLFVTLNLMLVSLSGCASFTDKPISADSGLAQLEGRSLADGRLTSFLQRNLPTGTAATPEKWDARHLELAAFYFNPDLDTARADLAAARAADITAAQIPNPNLALTPTYDTTSPPPWILGLSFDVPIETAGKRGYREDQAAHLSDAAIANLAAAAWRVRGQVRSAFLALYAARQRQPLLQMQEETLSESTRIFDRELAIGEASPFEVTQSHIALNQVRFALQDNEAELTNARARLAAAIGVSPAALSAIQFDFTGLDVFPTDISEREARRQALFERPDVRAGLATYAATQSALQLEIAKQYPDIHLGPGYQRDQADDKWTLGLTFTLPIFNQNQGPIAEAEAKRAQAAARFDSLQTKILSDLEQAITNYRTALKKVQAAKALRDNLATQVNVADRMLKLGEISRIEHAQRQLELTNAALTQLTALVAAQTALSSVEDTLQSPDAVAAATAAAPRDQSEPSLAPLTQIGTIPLPSVKGGFDLMTVDLAGNRLFLDAEDNNTTEVIDLATSSPLHTITGMHQPKWVVYRPEINRLYIASGNGEVRVLDSRTYQPLKTIAFKEKANNLHFDPVTRELFVGVGATFGAIGIVDTRTDTISGEIALANAPNQFEIDGNLIYVNVPAENRIAVIDRKQRKVIATWPLTAAPGNFPMGIDRRHHRLFIGFKSGKLGIVDTSTGKEVAALDIAADSDGIYYDDARALIYVSCGAGSIDVIRQSDPDHYALASRVETAKGAGTSLYVPEQNRFYLAVPQRGDHLAEMRIYTVNAP